MEERAHAKVNFFLRVLRRREDGFHEIETLVAPISLYDSLEFSAAEEFSFSCSDSTLPTGEENLVVRAANLFFDETKIPAAVSIALTKKIPHAAGLGGGSSDAAATLRGLDKFFETKLTNEKLLALAARLGSDVPFFIEDQPAICRGRGEVIEPARLAQEFRLLLLKASFGVATPWSYSRWKEAREMPGVDYSPQSFAGLTLVNGLERPVFEKFIFLAFMKNWLRAQPEVAVGLMAGSGSTMFAILREPATADSLVARAGSELDQKLWSCACETMVTGNQAE